MFCWKRKCSKFIISLVWFSLNILIQFQVEEAWLRNHTTTFVFTRWEWNDCSKWITTNDTTFGIKKKVLGYTAVKKNWREMETSNKCYDHCDSLNQQALQYYHILIYFYEWIQLAVLPVCNRYKCHITFAILARSDIFKEVLN